MPPVLFWVHGGAYEQGLGNCALYDGTNFARKGIISVVINYRLGALGYMASASMKGTNFLTVRRQLYNIDTTVNRPITARNLSKDEY